MATFDRNDTFSKSAAVIAQELHVEQNIIKEESTFQDLGADSLDMVQIIMKFEEQFGMEVKDEDVENMKTLADVVDYLHERRTK